jgi:hypothetical protein
MTDEIERDRMAENDLARRRRVNQLGYAIGTAIHETVTVMKELRDAFGVQTSEAVRMGLASIVDHDMRKAAECLLEASLTEVIGMPHPSSPALEQLIDRLFAEFVKENAVPAAHAPAMECLVTLRAGGTLKGILSKTPEGVYRVMTPTSDRQHLVEHFFDLDDVQMVSLERTVTATAPSPRIIPAS